jgi:hypothetical protein
MQNNNPDTKVIKIPSSLAYSIEILLKYDFNTDFGFDDLFLYKHPRMR